MTEWAVDIPNFCGDEWDEVTVEDSREAAIRFARERFGADENGCICLVSEIPVDSDAFMGIPYLGSIRKIRGSA